jgi:nitrite reductase/ring-hydroxylating ferredoxin subunit
MPWASLCELDEILDGEAKYAEVDGFKLAVFRQGTKVFVLDDTCPHAKASMSNGWIDRGCAVCPAHAWAFKLEDGSLRDAPGTVLRTYPARLKTLPDGRVLVQADLPGY